ncbi:cytochrome b/b6 domain-containing protein [Candidatus Methylacidiphilum infernorum]|uniref:Cytochrome b/b6 domain-containing protein n=1 Tax=Candidatus Methylacidiphilum infernorum TaxID=511746 RepID=A0ABX7PXQ1_9BACT|nr:cytochrome b/b6 domain-containing protein [Candidatus Methylacidiphilum infernorum]
MSYFVTVFIAPLVSIATGLLQSPAISNRLGLIGRILNRRAARSIHFISLLWFVFFILMHVIMVLITGIPLNTNPMFSLGNSLDEEREPAFRESGVVSRGLKPAFFLEKAFACDRLWVCWLKKTR